jgi:hypothetical protein
MRTARISPAREVDSKQRSGTQVRISELDKDWNLEAPGALQEVTESFALYLTEYPTVSILFNGTNVNPAAAILNRRSYTLTSVKFDEQEFPMVLDVVEWKQQTDRMLYLCDDSGLPLHRVLPMIHAPGFEFSAYLKVRTIHG